MSLLLRPCRWLTVSVVWARSVYVCCFAGFGFLWWCSCIHRGISHIQKEWVLWVSDLADREIYTILLLSSYGSRSSLPYRIPSFVTGAPKKDEKRSAIIHLFVDVDDCWDLYMGGRARTSCLLHYCTYGVVCELYHTGSSRQPTVHTVRRKDFVRPTNYSWMPSDEIFQIYLVGCFK